MITVTNLAIQFGKKVLYKDVNLLSKLDCQICNCNHLNFLNLLYYLGGKVIKKIPKYQETIKKSVIFAFLFGSFKKS